MLVEKLVSGILFLGILGLFYQHYYYADKFITELNVKQVNKESIQIEHERIQETYSNISNIRNTLEKDKICGEDKVFVRIEDTEDLKELIQIRCGESPIIYGIPNPEYKEKDFNHFYEDLKFNASLDFIKEMKDSKEYQSVLNLYTANKRYPLITDYFYNQKFKLSILPFYSVCKKLKHTNSYCIDLFDNTQPSDIQTFIINGKEELGEYK